MKDKKNDPKKVSGDDAIVENIVVLFLIMFFIFIFVKVVFL